MREKGRFLNIIINTITVFVLFFTIVKLYKPSIPPNIMDTKEGLVAMKLSKGFSNFLALGQQRLLSSFFWVESMLNADIKHHKDKTDHSALYYKYKTILDLDPYFYEVYLNGGVYLSIVKDDDMGAKLIYDRGLKYFPNDYYLLNQSGFHYYFELGDHQGSIERFERILETKKGKIPKHLPVLVARLKTLTNNGLEEARIMLYEAWKKAPQDSPQKKYLFLRLYSIQTELDLTCLNSGKTNCRKVDLEGKPYLFKGGQFKAQRIWKPFRMKKRS